VAAAEDSVYTARLTRFGILAMVLMKSFITEVWGCEVS